MAIAYHKDKPISFGMTKRDATRLAQLVEEIDGRSVRIGAYDFVIECFEDWLINPENNSPNWGYCSQNDQRILIGNISGTPSSAMLAGTLIHEIMHAVWGSRKLPNGSLEESHVLMLEEGIISLYRDNPWLLDWLKKALA